MSHITISKFEVTAKGILTADIRWDPADPDNGGVPTRINVPNGGIATIAVSVTSEQALRYITIAIVPDDVPYRDVFNLPVILDNPLPAILKKAKLPSLGLGVFYKIKSLAGTKFGLRLTNKP